MVALSRLHDRLKSIRVLASVRAKSIPSLFLPVARLRENNKRIAIRPTTDIVIEGYWRCGNHFATYAFLAAQPNEPHVAHHFHAPAQLLLAVRWGIPAVLLIRDPLPAIASATVFLERNDPAVLIDFYNLFHQAVLPIAGRVVVADFPTTVNNMGRVIECLNSKFGTTFTEYCHSSTADADVRKAIEAEHQQHMAGKEATLPLPSKKKSQAKSEIMDRLRADSNSRKLRLAASLYEELRAFSV